MTQPIDLLRVQHKLRNEEYDDIDQLTQDIELMINNAKAFYSVRTEQECSHNFACCPVILGSSSQ